MKHIYHEKQYGNYCRCHALNNLIGEQMLSRAEFDSLCDKYDKTHGFHTQVTRRTHLFCNNGGTDNIFGFCLEEKGYNIMMNHYDFYRNVVVKCSANTLGYIVYNAHHTYCVRIVDGEFYLIDSMRRGVQKLNDLRIIQRPGIGVIEVIRA